MIEITVHHVVSLCPRTQALIEQLAAAWRSAAQPPSAVPPSPPQTEVPGESGPAIVVSSGPRAEMPGRGARGTAGEASPPPRAFSEDAPAVMAGDPPAAPDVPGRPAKPKRTVSPEHLEGLRRRCAAMRAAKAQGLPYSPVWTPGRDAILCRDYPAGVALDDIHAALRALPGEPVARERTAIVREDYPTRTPIRDMLIDINMLPGLRVELHHIHTHAAGMNLARPGVEPASKAA